MLTFADHATEHRRVKKTCAAIKTDCYVPRAFVETPCHNSKHEPAY